MGRAESVVAVLAFVVISLLLMFLIGPAGECVGGAIETGYEARNSNTRLAVATATASGAEVVTAAEYAASFAGEER